VPSDPEPGGLKKTEELYRLSREAYDAEDRRFDNTEAKIVRYLSILFVVLGLSTFSADQLLAAAKPQAEARHYLLALSLFAFYVSGIVAFQYFVRAIRLQDIRALRLDAALVEYFDRYEYADALKNLAKAFLNAGAVIRGHVEEKLTLAARGFVALLVTVAFALLSVASYLYIQYAEVNAMSQGGKNEQTQEQPTQEPSSAEQPSGQPSPSSAESDAQNLFQDLKKSFEGGSERRSEGSED